MRVPGSRHSASKTRVNALMSHPGYVYDGLRSQAITSSAFLSGGKTG